MPLEKPVFPLTKPRQMLADFGGTYAASAVVAFLFAASGPVAIILAVGARGGLSESDIASWIFGAFFINGLMSIGFSILYRQPLVFLWSIPGAVLLGPALGHLSFPEVIGAFLATGVLMLLLLAGTVDRDYESAILAGKAKFDPLRSNRAEFYSFFLFSLTGLMLCASAESLIWLFLALELTSLPTYIMVTISTRTTRSQEAGVKYFFLGALGAAIFLYGFAQGILASN